MRDAVWGARFVLGVLVGALLLGCSAPQAPTPRLVVLYASCSVAKDFLSPYDASIPFTPALGRFAAEGLVFERHQTESGQSGTAFASIFSGGQAPHHGIWAHPTPMPDDVLLITEAYARAGWDVHAWLEHAMAGAHLGYGRGTPAANVHRGHLRGGSPDLKRILRRLEREPDYRAFLVTNFTVTHSPYRMAAIAPFCRAHPQECAERDRILPYAELYYANTLPLSWDRERAMRELGIGPAELAGLARFARLAYSANVFELDRAFGRVVSAIDEGGLADESLIAFTADHGELLYRENAIFPWSHGYELAPEVLGVPLVLRGPGIAPGRYAGVTRSVDVLPTLAGLSGVPLPGFSGSGVDLSRAVRGEEAPPTLVAYSHTALFSEVIWKHYRRFGGLVAQFPDRSPEYLWAAARSGDRLYRLTRPDGGPLRATVVDLTRDPADPSAERPADRPEDRETVARLRAYRERLIARAGPAAPSEAVPAGEQEDLLRSLGYVE